MTGLVDWAASRARMVIGFIVLSLLAGTFSYVGLPKEGEPDIEVPALFVSLQFPGISAEDSEKLLVKVMENELADLDGLDNLYGTAAEGYAGVALEFEFGWDKTQVMADVRDAMDAAEADFPAGFEKYSINELNFSTFPIVIVSLSGPVPERTMVHIGKDLQDRLEAMEPILEAGIAGDRDELMEVVIDPLQLEAYNVTAEELINVVTNNNRLIAAGTLQSEQGAFSVKIPSSFDEALDIYNLPVKTNGDRVVTLGDLTTINLTFEDRVGTARFNGENTIALQVVKRKGFNIIDTVAQVKEELEKAKATWPPELRIALKIETAIDQSRNIKSMVKQLEGSVLTAITLVMMVTLAALGIRPALLVGFAIPTSFLLCFALLAIMDVAVSNIVMFGLILAVGMLVDGAIVVVEYADKRIAQGEGPMNAYVAAAKRMFWPVVSSTATTLCAFLPMLFWPGVAGQFMRMLPVTLIFVLSASLLVALIYLPVMGGVTGRLERWIGDRMDRIAKSHFIWHIALFILAGAALTALGAISPIGGQIGATFAAMDGTQILTSVVPTFVQVFGLAMLALLAAIVGFAGAVTGLLALFALVSRGKFLVTAGWRWAVPRRAEKVKTGYRRSPFGQLIHLIAANPVAPILACCAVFVIIGSIFMFYSNNNRGVEFFVESEPENALIYVKARGNLSIEQKDMLVRDVENVVLQHPNVLNAFAFAGAGGLNNNTGGAQAPLDTIGRVQIELIKWEERKTASETWFTVPLIGYEVKRTVTDATVDGQRTLSELTQSLRGLPGIKTEILALEDGPAAAKPLHLRIRGNNPDVLEAFTRQARAVFEQTEGLVRIEDTLPLPGIDWQINVDVEKAGRYGADVAAVGAMVQLVTRGLILGQMRVPSSDEEIDIRVRLPEDDRVLATLDTLKVRTNDGLVPLANFISRKPVKKREQIDRIDQTRYFDVKADVTPGLMKTVTNDDGTTSEVTINPTERIETLTTWLESGVIPPGITWEWTGDAEDQKESGEFLQTAFMGALGLMFIILLAQFNSVYNAALVLLAVILSTAGVLVGMVVMDQPFSIIMTGTGIVALAGIVVNNNIVLIDTYQEYSRYMPRIEAITRTAEARIRPVLLTTVTTMAGLAPMMFGLSLDFFGGGYTFNAPTALWWKQLATAVVFGLGIATALTLIFTPSMLALRVWATTYVLWASHLMAKLSFGRSSRAARDWALERQAARQQSPEIVWTEHPFEPAPVAELSLEPEPDPAPKTLLDPNGNPMRAAE
ncbi:MAG: efflux RND transporter permease subunit [Pseudomonadota bacterium]